MTRAVFFDMDGTITRPVIDWHELRQRAGIPDGEPIMPYIDSLPPEAAERARSTVETIEMDAAREAELNPGARELIHGLRSLGLSLALITNNHRAAMRAVVGKFSLEFDLLLSREDADLKPAPDLLHLALRRLCLEPNDACFIGDGRYDRMACEAAGVRYIHLSHDPAAATDDESSITSLNEAWHHLRPGARSRQSKERKE